MLRDKNANKVFDYNQITTDINNLKDKNTDTGWQDLELINDYTATQYGNPPRYRKIGNIVFLNGNVIGGNGENIVGYLPEGFRPSEPWSTTIVRYGADYSLLSINEGTANGALYLYKTDGKEFGLFNISFLAE